MFCPSCRDEFRVGFTRCAACGVDLVPEVGGPLKDVAASRAAADSPKAAHAPMTDFCGFLALGEARDARERLRAMGIRTELVLRDAPGAPEGEEYWLRVEQARLAEVILELGYDPADGADGAGELRCGACGETVATDAPTCSRCGARFEDGT